jgi:hypothetical protein
VTEFRFPWDDVAPAPASPAPFAAPAKHELKPRRGRPKGLGRAADLLARWPHPAETPGVGEGAAPLHHTEWLACRLSVTGTEDAVGAFAAAAAGAGVTPWLRDFAAEEEDLFYRLAARYPQTGRLSLDACRRFAAQFRERAQDQHDRALAAVGHSRACPFDLHVLLPVPPAILALGVQHPEAQRWLAAQWGTTELRKAWLHPEKARPRPPAALRYSFFAADSLPRAAVRRLAKAWPELSLELHTDAVT